MFENTMWWMFGWVTGVLCLMQLQVWKARQARRNPHQSNPNFIPIDERLAQEWSVAELEKWQPVARSTEPEAVSVMQECEICGKAYKRLATHTTRMHPAVRIAKEEETSDE